MAAGRLFDAYLMVDWSARAEPCTGKDSIWIARAEDTGVDLCNPATRAEAKAWLRRELIALREAGKRVLVGFDFPFGYPAGTALRVAGEPEWRALWEWIAQRLLDDRDNRNNRYAVAESFNTDAFDGAGPFWGHPHPRYDGRLPRLKPGGYGDRYPAERRMVEARVRSAHVVWKLVGSGQVGGQVLTGLPAVLSLRDDPALENDTAIWPFECGEEPEALPPIVLAEIYPSLEQLPEGEQVKDARQVTAVVEDLVRADQGGWLADLIRAPWGLPEPERRAVLREEAWMLNLAPAAADTSGGRPGGRNAPQVSPWLSIVGLGEDGPEGLSPAARALVEGAEVLVGGARHLAMLPPGEGDRRERLSWPRPLTDLLPVLEARRGRAVCVLATGDPLCYGIGTTLLRRFDPAECRILPAPSAFALACARLGWTLDRVETLTLHGRPLELVLARLYPGARILALSDGADTPAEVAELLVARGLDAARLVVLEHMGGPKERRVEATAGDWGGRSVAAFNALAVEIPAEAALPAACRLAGLPDSAFLSDGQMTKREVRAATLAALAPWPGALLWDVGAGCGSVAVEWLRSDPRCRAVAVEARAQRIALIAGNAAALGAPHLRIVEGRAPEALDGLERDGRPDAVFVGGGLDGEGVFEACWAALRPGGRLVANVVTLEGEARVLALQAAHGGALTRIAVSRAEPVGPFQGWRPLMAVTQWSVEKPREPAP